MLMLFPTVKVPGLDDIEIFRDHEKDDTFYALRGRPKIALDDQGNPQLSFNFFERNADIAYASSANKDLVETQLGQLLFTTDLSVSEDEHNKITDYLGSLLEQQNHPFVSLYSKLRGFQLLLRRDAKPVIKLGTPNTWKDGTAKLEILEGLGETFKKSSSAEVKPSLVGSNSASFYATFGIEGSQIYYDALTKGYSGNDPNAKDLTPLQAIVRYDLKGFAFVPNIEVTVTANSSQMFTQMQSFQEDYRKENRGTLRIESSWFSTTTTDSRSVMASKADIAKFVERMIDAKVINIDITDFADVAANSDEIKEVETSLRTSLMDMIMNTIIPNFFNTAFVGDDKKDTADDDKKDDDGTGKKGNGKPAPDANTGITDAERTKPTVDSHYYFRNDVDKTKITSLYFHFKKNGTVEFRRYPNGVLITNLTDEQRKNLVKRIDISSPEVQILEVQMAVNANFTEDGINSVIINVSYSQRDFKSQMVRENSKSFTYRKGDEVFTFRVTMARNEKNELIDFYNVEAKIAYSGTATSPPPIKLSNISDRSLVISYDKLGFITVNCIAGDIDWTLIKEAIINLRYNDEPNQPDTKKEIRLTKDVPNGNWRCYMYGHSSKNYMYKTKYLYIDGQEGESEEKTESKGTLMIDDLLTGRAKASFDVILDVKTVKTAKVEILYEDIALAIKEEYSHWFTGTETWDWSMRLHQGAKDVFKYRYFVQYSDDVVYTSPWMESRTDEDIPPIHLRRIIKAFTIDGGLLDWTKWKVVYVDVKYEEPDNNYFIESTIRVDANSPLKSFEVMSFTPEGKPFKYSLQFAKADGVVPVAETTSQGSLLLLKEPA